MLRDSVVFHPRQKKVATSIANWILNHVYLYGNSKPLLIIQKKMGLTCNTQTFSNVIRVMLNRGWIRRERKERSYFHYQVQWEQLESDQYAERFFGGCTNRN